jgi:hypothetical protein
MELRYFSAIYGCEPDIPIRKDPSYSIPMWDHLPHSLLRGFDIVEVKYQVPTVMSTCRTNSVYVAIPPVQHISG